MILRDILHTANDPLADEGTLREHINRALAATPTRGIEARFQQSLTNLWCRPRLYNTERLPDRPCLFIGNHALFGLDGLVILPLMQERCGRFLRPLGDKFLFSQKPVADFLLRRGAAMGHPDVARALMAHDQDILVFPGGAHEAVKASRDRYTLQWKDRLGFVRLAAEFGYTIVPFALVGPDEFYEYWLDSEQVTALFRRIGLWREGMRADAIPPLARGSFGTLLPRPQASFLSFAEPLALPTPGPRAASRRQLVQWRRSVAARIEAEIAHMLLERERHRHEFGLLRRLATL
jgi:hypothetical protein